MINQNFSSSIYHSQINTTLETINTTVEESLNKEKTSLSKLKIIAGFFLFRTKTSVIKALASSIGANIIYNDISQIIKLARNISTYKVGVKELNNLEKFIIDATTQLRHTHGVEKSTRGKVDQEIFSLKTIVVEGKDYFRGITSSASKELLFKIFKIASVALIGFGVFSVSKPLIITGGIVYLVSRLLISRNHVDLSVNGGALSKKIIVMNSIINQQLYNYPSHLRVHQYQVSPPQNYQSQQRVHPYQVSPPQNYQFQPQYIQNPVALQPVYWTPTQQ